MKEAKYYKNLDNSTVQCLLCNHFCAIGKNKTGLCQTRKNINGKLYTMVYGYPVAMNVDPIEKKPLFHFYPNSLTYSLGTLGCNFACENCQNWDISQAGSIEKIISKMDDYISPEKIVENALGDDCKSIAYTYNEPTIFTEYALDIMRLARSNGLKNVWVSNGYINKKVLADIIPYLDAVNIDLKSFDDEFYSSNCKAKLRPVLENLQFLKQEQVHLEITTLIIPGKSSNIEMLAQLADFIVTQLDTDVPWHITRFNPEISWKLKDLQETGDDLIYEAHQ
ncbi:AmmeMemoRadiSam system radical SAM enzyme, partial [Candidatus Falkowbacteria bacterium]